MQQLSGRRFVLTMFFKMLTATCAIGILAVSAQAAPLIFFGEDLNSLGDPNRPPTLANSTSARNDFFSHLAGVSTENFESFAVLANPGALTFGEDTALFNGAPYIRSVPVGTYNGTFPISGDKFLFHFGNTGIFSITFSTPQAAFGFFGTDIGDGAADLFLNFSGATVKVPHAVPVGTGSALYFGIIDTDNPFTSVTFTNTNAALDGFGFDDMTIGRLAHIVPEPGTLALACCALLGLLGLPRRHRLSFFGR